MKLVLDNLTYHDCPVELREKVTFAPEQRQAMLKAMHHTQEISEAVILQTCNRLEFYLYTRKDLDCRAFVGDLLASQSPEAAKVWSDHRREKTGMDVARHLFEVAAGLDSQMVGENQIQGQVKSAYTESLEAHMSKLIFHRLFHHAFRVGKAVRTHTDINCGAVSIGLAAVELAKNKVNLNHARAMVIGAGENAELVVRNLMKAGLSNLVIANRDADKAGAMVRRFGATKGIGLDGIGRQLGDVDLIIGSTAATEPILTYDSAAWHLAERTKPLLIIDIAVPRDVDPSMKRFDFVTLYNIDDLNGQIDANRDRRNSEVPKARTIVEEFVTVFAQWYDSLDLVPVISRLTQAGLDLARTEAKRYAGDFGNGNGDKLQAFAESLVKKLLHGPISIIKDGAGEPTVEQLQAVDLINRMFLSQDKGGE